jgi:hypothetical protein
MQPQMSIGTCAWFRLATTREYSNPCVPLIYTTQDFQQLLELNLVSRKLLATNC